MDERALWDLFGSADKEENTLGWQRLFGMIEIFYDSFNTTIFKRISYANSNNGLPKSDEWKKN